jgi:hypothetical protein
MHQTKFKVVDRIEPVASGGKTVVKLEEIP